MILKLEPDQPYTLTLKYPTGKQVDGNWGPQLRWILGNGDLLYTPMDLGAQIEDLGIRPGQKFTLTKVTNGRSFKWIAERTTHFPSANEAPAVRPGPQRAATPVRHETQTPSKTAIASILDASEPLDGIPLPTPTTRLEDALKTAVAAAAAAEAFAASIGYTCRFSPTDIKAMGISVLIGSQQGGRYAA